jgi:hypothetical protein
LKKVPAGHMHVPPVIEAVPTIQAVQVEASVQVAQPVPQASQTFETVLKKLVEVEQEHPAPSLVIFPESKQVVQSVLSTQSSHPAPQSRHVFDPSKY